MESNKDKNIVVIILSIVILLLLGVCICLGIIISKGEYKEDDIQDRFEDEAIKEEKDEVSDEVDNCITSDEYDVNIEILSMNKPNITVDSLDHHLYIFGDMRISYKEDYFQVVGLEGYCLGDSNEKYMVYGPKGSEMSFKNGDKEYYLVNDTTKDVIYSDGTKKSIGDVDWKNVKIKSCMIEKLYTVYNKNGKTVISYTTLEYEKVFN